MERARRNQALVRTLLSELVDEIEVEGWLNTPNTALEGARPISSIEQGETQRVIELLERVRQGIYI